MADRGAIVDAGQPLEDAVGRIARRRQVLPHGDRAGVAVEGHEVGEGAADVDAHQIACHSHLCFDVFVRPIAQSGCMTVVRASTSSA